ncbi:hypothetical protein LJE86_05180 [bacterium BMS3Abin03]|nr:hypothetical protein [bacterium BMS3Abin03]
MKRFILNSVSFVIIFIMMILNSQSVFSQTKDGWKNLKYALFFTNGDVHRLLADEDSFNKTMEYFAPIKIQKVYLEGKNRGEEDVDLMKSVADRFRKIGITPVGAMVPTSEKGGPCCYNDPNDLASLKRRMTALASVFDEIILDDWLFTICTCDECVEARGGMSWATYRTRLILEKSKQYIIDPAKKVNPNVTIIIKYPNWYEGHRLNGYDVYMETHQFDKMAVGIETRIPETQDQHIPTYSGYIFQKWWSGVDTSKWVGSWLDNYKMRGGWNDYNAQVWQAILAKTPEIILWCAGQLYPPNPSSDVYPHFVKMLPEFDRVAGLLKGNAHGVPIYLPYGSTGEYNIFGYFGEIGIPLNPVAEFPKDSKNAIFTLHSLQDPTLEDQMIQRLRDGHDLFMTWSIWKKLQDSEFKNTLELNPHGGFVTSSEFRLRNGWNNIEFKSDKAFTFPRIETTTWPYVRSVAVVEEDYDLGVFLDITYLNGHIYILNMPENSYDLFRLPVEVLNRIRSAFNDELGFTLQGPGKIAVYPYGKNQYVLYNMNDDEANVDLRFSGKIETTGWKEIVNNSKISVIENKPTTQNWEGQAQVTTDVSIKLKPFEISIVQAP